MRAPCRGCDKRTATCHTDCADYIAFRFVQDMILDEKASETEALTDFVELVRSREKRKQQDYHRKLDEKRREWRKR